MADKTKGQLSKFDQVPELVTRPLAAPIYPATVYCCDSPDQASQLLAGESAGFVYSRDGHPNAHMLAARCAELHAADRAAITGSGMSALALGLLTQLRQGDHVVVSHQLYGRSLTLFTAEAERIGVASTQADICDPLAVEAAFNDSTRLLVIETIANPMLRLADIAALADLAHARQAKLLVDNTFASPALCRPLELGADLVVESITKIMNGHSDVMLGLLCGTDDAWERVPSVHTTWGFFASPIDCWLAARGLATLGLRMERASANALVVAARLANDPAVAELYYPGLPSHRDYELAGRMLSGGFGNMLTFQLRGDRSVAERFIRAVAPVIPFCPSLGELTTTLSHPASTSHRALSETARAGLGITEGTIRLSVGIEPCDEIARALEEGLAALR